MNGIAGDRPEVARADAVTAVYTSIVIDHCDIAPHGYGPDRADRDTNAASAAQSGLNGQPGLSVRLVNGPCRLL
jgi:hypothetical protein